MSNNYQKREVTYYGKRDEPTIQITVNVYGHNSGLTNDELNFAADKLASDAMVAITQSPYTKIPLSRVDVKRPRK